MMSPRKDLTLSEKCEILKRFDALPKCSQRVASKLLAIPQSSLSRILQKRDAITAEVSINFNADRKRKRSGKGSIMEKFLFDWFLKTTEKNEPLSRSILLRKADEMAKQHGLDNFVATDGWLTRWIARNKISLKKRSLENRQNVIIECANNWIAENVPVILEKYAPNQIYNSDEAVIHFYDASEHPKKLSEKDLQPITVVLTCNMIGEKEYPLIVGKGAFSEYEDVKEFPLHYECSEDGFITRDIFASFLMRWDVALKNKNIVLLLDSSYNHFENLTLKNIKMVFIPSDLTSVVQPLSQGIIQIFKSSYKRSIKMKVDDVASSVVLTNATLISLVEAWLKVQSTFICDCFRKAGFSFKSDDKINVVKDISKSNCNSDIKSSIDCFNTVSEKTDGSIVANLECDIVLQSGANETLDQLYLNLDKKDAETQICLECEENKAVAVSDACSAFSVIRKTLDQKSAPLLCYELLQKLEEEVNELLQKSS